MLESLISCAVGRLFDRPDDEPSVDSARTRPPKSGHGYAMHVEREPVEVMTASGRDVPGLPFADTGSERPRGIDRSAAVQEALVANPLRSRC